MATQVASPINFSDSLNGSGVADLGAGQLNFGEGKGFAVSIWWLAEWSWCRLSILPNLEELLEILAPRGHNGASPIWRGRVADQVRRGSNWKFSNFLKSIRIQTFRLSGLDKTWRSKGWGNSKELVMRVILLKVEEVVESNHKGKAQCSKSDIQKGQGSNGKNFSTMF